MEQEKTVALHSVAAIPHAPAISPTMTDTPCKPKAKKTKAEKLAEKAARATVQAHIEALPEKRLSKAYKALIGAKEISLKSKRAAVRKAVNDMPANVIESLFLTYAKASADKKVMQSALKALFKKSDILSCFGFIADYPMPKDTEKATEEEPVEETPADTEEITDNGEAEEI